jgi:hypothetical protein
MGRQDASQLDSRTGSLVRFRPRTIVFHPVIANYFHEENIYLREEKDLFM